MARAARKLAHILVAALLILAGTAMLVLPGPGLVTIAVGLGMLGRELQWAWVLRAERRLRSTVDRWMERFERPLSRVLA